jgi:hypothetical protein
LEKEIIQFQANRILGGCVTAGLVGVAQRAKGLGIGKVHCNGREERKVAKLNKAKARQRPIHPKLLLLHPTGSTK